MLFFSSSLSKTQYTTLKKELLTRIHQKDLENYQSTSPQQLKALQRILIEHIYDNIQALALDKTNALTHFDSSDVETFTRVFEQNVGGLGAEDKEKVLSFLHISHQLYDNASANAKQKLLWDGLKHMAALFSGICFYLKTTLTITNTVESINSIDSAIKGMSQGATLLNQFTAGSTAQLGLGFQDLLGGPIKKGNSLTEHTQAIGDLIDNLTSAGKLIGNISSVFGLAAMARLIQVGIDAYTLYQDAKMDDSLERVRNKFTVT